MTLKTYDLSKPQQATEALALAIPTMKDGFTVRTGAGDLVVPEEDAILLMQTLAHLVGLRVAGPSAQPVPKKLYLVGTGFSCGSAENVTVAGMSAAFELAERNSKLPDVVESSVWLGWCPLRTYKNGVVAREFDGSPAY
ncbi:hypothetical protein [Pseudomonas sp. GOM6]|uniref:hypothetical protein n=1 Tax=Pseudomonas sp. GOM6 TaxID=3036944 RepID=UPI002409C323|nr:hypothetical protein [Pseudomonas sp. GOM6]MDG1581015.1 hypothetical protein [Pseudomonas sp. GOM6]